jgi:hypothetical protein
VSGETTIHATRRAIAIVRTRSENFLREPMDVLACGTPNWIARAETRFCANDAASILGLKGAAAPRLGCLPTCQACRVLLDAALENPKETP